MKKLFCILFASLSLSAFAQQSIQFDGCKDRAGNAVPALADSSFTGVAGLGVVEGKTVIRHNAAVLPRLLPESRLFVFAYECGRKFLGLTGEAELTMAQVRQADCWAVDILQRSGLVKDKTLLGAIEDDLSMVPEDWALLPGPRRVLNLATCKAPAGQKGALKLDTGAVPADKWNSCQQGCASKLFSCGRGANCQSAFDQCSAACGGK